MAVRGTMAGVITSLRRLVYDPVGANQVFTDQEIQNFLDDNRQDVNILELDPKPEIGFGGVVTYTQYYSPKGSPNSEWETDVKLQQSDWAVLTPLTSDYSVGKWTFTTQPLYPVYITGQFYDLAGAAADCLRAWLMIFAEKYNFSGGGQSFSFNQIFTNRQALLDKFEERRYAQITKLVRDDQ